MSLLITWLTGLLFGVGIAISGMANPAKVINFFDVAGSWDPSLAFVMGGAVVVTGIGYQRVLRQSAPLFEARFHVPATQAIDARLIGGSALFGLGWGLTGFCPGGALPALGTLVPAVFVFVLAMLAGIAVARQLDTMLHNPRHPGESRP